MEDVNSTVFENMKPEENVWKGQFESHTNLREYNTIIYLKL